MHLCLQVNATSSLLALKYVRKTDAEYSAGV